MATKTVRLDEDVYERIEAHKRENETFSEAIDRLVEDWTVLDYDTGRSDEDIEAHRAAIADSERIGIEKTDELVGQLDERSESE